VRRISPFDSEAKLIFMQFPSRTRRSLNELAAASGCSPFEIVWRFREGAGHAEFPEPPSNPQGPAASEPRRPAKAGNKT
jgi:hypothetical protein